MFNRYETEYDSVCIVCQVNRLLLQQDVKYVSKQKSGQHRILVTLNIVVCNTPDRGADHFIRKPSINSSNASDKSAKASHLTSII